LRGVLLRPSGSRSSPRGSLQARVLATDSYRTESLLQGDVGGSSDSIQFTNITRVTPPRPASLDARLPWRVNAYARMPVAQFGQAGPLAGYLDVHDVTGARSAVTPGADPASAGVVSAKRSGVKRVEGDEVFLGDQVDLTLDEGVFGGPAATWLIGELLARAITERADFLRYTRTRLVHESSGVVRVDYGVRQGERLPLPFG
jgi:type VI protein secretion system component VasA